MDRKTDKETTEEQKARRDAMLKDYKAWMEYYFPQYKPKAQ